MISTRELRVSSCLAARRSTCRLRDDEPVQIQRISILHRGAIDLGDEPTRPRERRAVESRPLPDGRRAPSAFARMLPAAAAHLHPELAPKPARARASERRAREVVIPDECQSIPITAPND